MTISFKLEELSAQKRDSLRLKRQELEYEFLQFMAKAEDLIFNNPNFLGDSIKELATALCIEAGKIPPHFTDWVDCKHCGIMVTEPHGGPRDMPVVACPWCSSTTHDFRRQNKEIKTLRDLAA